MLFRRVLVRTKRKDPLTTITYTLSIQQQTLLKLMVGLSRFELLTPRLSSVCSNQLSYRPSSPPPRVTAALSPLSKNQLAPILSKLDRRARQQNRLTSCQIDHRVRVRYSLMLGLKTENDTKHQTLFSRKEVIQPQVLLQLPCYDFTPITNHTLGTYLPRTGWHSDF